LLSLSFLFLFSFFSLSFLFLFFSFTLSYSSIADDCWIAKILARFFAPDRHKRHSIVIFRMSQCGIFKTTMHGGFLARPLFASPLAAREAELSTAAPGL
jgi:hypothetical protein